MTRHIIIRNNADAINAQNAMHSDANNAQKMSILAELFKFKKKQAIKLV